MSEVADKYAVHPPSMRWTHIALPATDIDKTIDWYERYTPLELLDRREDADGQGAWLGHRDQVDKPFILVLVSFIRDHDKGPQPIMAPFAHIGIEVTSRAEVDSIAARGEAGLCGRVGRSRRRAKPKVAWPGLPPRCRRRSATSVPSPIPTAT